MGDTVVGPGKGPVQGPKVSDTQLNPQTATAYIEAINTRLKSQGVEVANEAEITASDAWIKSLTPAQTRELAAAFKKMGKNVKDTKTLADLLTQYPEVTTAKDYITGYNTLVGMIIPGTDTAGTANLPTQTVTQYTDKQLTDISNTIAQDFLKRNLEQAEIDVIMPKLKKLVQQGTTTTSKRVGGKNVVTVTPGFSTAAAQGIVQAELKKTAQDDLQVKQYQDFQDWLSQNMAGM